MWDTILDVLLDTAIDGAKMLPFLFAAYLIIEYIEHRASDKLTHALSHSGKLGVPIGALLGTVPQCGFSVVAANLYGGRIITAGTLIAVFVSTSDEALPVLLSDPSAAGKLALLIPIKIVLAIAAGWLADALFFRRKEHCAPHCHHDDERAEAVEHICEHCGCDHESIWVSALKHTGSTFLFLIIVLLAINLLSALIGEERIASIMLSGSIFQPFVTALIGLIPNCMPSVVIAELYASGTVSLGGAVAGLSTGAGLGLAMLFKINRHAKENIKIIVFIYVFAVVAGIAADLIYGLFI